MRKYLLAGIGMAGLLGSVLLLQGCWDPGCTLKGCGTAIDITFVPVLQQEGTYEFEVHLEAGETVFCTITIPVQRHEPCIGPSRWHHSHFRTTNQPEGDRVESLHLWGAPDSFELVIRKDGEQMSRTTHHPKYGRYYPNGPQCDGITDPCPTAAVQVDL